MTTPIVADTLKATVPEGAAVFLTPPHIMHIDLNSCFATVEQQARPRLRGRPVAVLNRRTPDTSIVAASYEAKARGVKVGMKFYEAQRLCPEIVGIDSDPPKYRHVYHELLRIMSSYSPAVAMKSIDEGVISPKKDRSMNCKARLMKLWNLSVRTNAND